MVRKGLVCVLLPVLIASLGLVAVGAAPLATGESAELTIVNTGGITGADQPVRPAAAKTPPVVNISAPLPGATVNGSVPIEATATDEQGIKKVEYSVDGADWASMSNVGGDTYQTMWDSTTVADGNHTITVRATDARNAKGEDSVSVVTQNGNEPPPQTTYELTIEIDYMSGHYPTQAVLDYIQWYYWGNNPSGDLIGVTFVIDEEVPRDPAISSADFWAIERDYNNKGTDNAGGDPVNGVYDSNEKWVLYGTSVEGSPGTVGYCYVALEGRVKQDGLYGNYILIADETADSIENYGAEAVVLMHEMGHSIGIGNFRLNQEIYDRDAGSVMSYLSTANTTLYGEWYYSAKYWDTRNLEYYVAG